MILAQLPLGFETFTPNKNDLLKYPLFLGNPRSGKWLLIENADEFMSLLIDSYTFAAPVEGSYLDAALKEGVTLSEMVYPPVHMWTNKKQTEPSTTPQQ